jgi:chromosomal replication initiation ATPase DnaA
MHPIIKIVARYYNCPADSLTAPSRTYPLHRYRQVAMYMLYAFTELGYGGIARRFHRSRHTIMAAVSKVHGELKVYPEYDHELQRIRRLIIRETL